MLESERGAGHAMLVSRREQSIGDRETDPMPVGRDFNAQFA
jgi:hypothetical protein